MTDSLREESRRDRESLLRFINILSEQEIHSANPAVRRHLTSLFAQSEANAIDSQKLVGTATSLFVSDPKIKELIEAVNRGDVISIGEKVQSAEYLQRL